MPVFYPHFGKGAGGILISGWHGAWAIDGTARSLCGRRFGPGGVGKVTGGVRKSPWQGSRLVSGRDPVGIFQFSLAEEAQGSGSTGCSPD